MAIDQSLLNELTTNAAEFLANSLPRHLNGMTLDERDGSCEIVLENPYQPDAPIRISTAGGEVTLEFGLCHSHFSSSDGSWSEADLVGEMVVKVAALVGGFEASYAAWAGDRCLGGGWLPKGATGREPFDHFPEADRIKVVAWEPWNNRDIRRSEPGGSPDGP
jgi:hypothetical protein